jgi:hypothetical protein
VQNMFFKVVSIAIGLALLSPDIAWAGFRKIPVSRCSGSELPIIDISPRYGLNISFIKLNNATGELVQQIRVSDPSRIVFDTDSKLGNKGGGDASGGAAIVFVRQLSKPIDSSQMRLQPQARNSKYVMLSLITSAPNNQRRLCQFRLHTGQDTADSTIEVTP